MLAFRLLLAATLMAGAALALASQPAAHGQVQQIESAKAAGVVGERVDGYLGIVRDGAADSSLIRKVNEINAKRRAVYDELAADTNTTTAQVARVTGEKQIERAAPGEYYMNESGNWVRKDGS
ncbi:MAG: DUF1318 domain-containing protein [Alphaproteobacteria bacterium]|nr:DUF1318 domain-containing protein [Alphaproteobacteria bacterium]